MNKNVKRIVAMTLAIGTTSVAAPATSANLLTTKAYALSNDEKELESLELLDESGNEIKLYDSDEYDKRVHDNEVDSDELYYAKTASKTVNIDISGPSKKYVRVFKGTSKTAEGKDVGEDIRMLQDTQTTLLIVKVYGEEPDDHVTADDDENYDLQSTYKIKVRYTGDGSSSTNNTNSNSTYSSSGEMTADDYDNIYLDKMSVDGNNIDLSESKINYSYDVNDSVEQVAVRAVPEDKDEDKVEIDNTEVDDYENYKKTINLKKGENKIQIDLTDEDDNERVYTLTINRGSTSSTTNNTNATVSGSGAGADMANATNKWIQVNGKWQYKDATGNAVKNSWIQNYYLQADGNMATGWLAYNNSWYYMGMDGAVKTGWQLVNGIWYFFDSQGKMVTGWMKDTNGKYYYLNSNGAMAYSTTINGYKLGANGAWTGR